MRINSHQNPNFLSREEVLLRRSCQAKQLFNMYKEEYWKLQEEIKKMHRNYYWEFGKSPFEESEKIEGKSEKERQICKFNHCVKRAMPLTTFCFNHILEDKEQTLYKGCRFVTRSSPSQIRCNKPVLRSTVPSYCSSHNQRYQKQMLQVMRMYGLSSTVKTAPKINVQLSECVKQIQARRRKAALDRSRNTVEIKEGVVCKDKLSPIVYFPCRKVTGTLQSNKGVTLQSNQGVTRPKTTEAQHGGSSGSVYSACTKPR